jgi:hypothetical protein
MIMFQPRTAKRTGFSLTDLLVGLAIVFVVIGVLLISIRLRNLERPLAEVRRPDPEVPKPGRTITRANFNRIELGMTQQQLKDVLGGPPGLYDGGSEFCAANCGPYIPLAMGADLGDDSVKFWFGAEIAVGVRFNEANRVVWKAVCPE